MIQTIFYKICVLWHVLPKQFFFNLSPYLALQSQMVLILKVIFDRKNLHLRILKFCYLDQNHMNKQQILLVTNPTTCPIRLHKNSRTCIVDRTTIKLTCQIVVRYFCLKLLPLTVLCKTLFCTENSENMTDVILHFQYTVSESAISCNI